MRYCTIRISLLKVRARSIEAEPNTMYDKIMIKKSPWPFVMLLSSRGA